MLKIPHLTVIVLALGLFACDSQDNESTQGNNAPQSAPVAETAPSNDGPTEFLTNDNMMAQIVGNSAEGDTESGDHYVEYYDPNGKIIGLSKKDGPYEGTWRLRQDNLMCFKYGAGPMDGGCVQVSLKDGKIGFTRMDGSEEPSATFIKGKASGL